MAEEQGGGSGTARKYTTPVAEAKALLGHLHVRDRLVRRRGKARGADPGTLVHTGPRRVETVRFQLFEYDGEVRERVPKSVPECFPFGPEGYVTWLNVDGLHDVEAIRSIGEQAKLHPLVMEDVLSTGQRPKIEDYGEQLYIVLRMLQYNEETDEIEEDQLSLILGASYVITFQEVPGDSFDPVRQRIRSGKGTIRGRGADFLAYSLIDAVVDEYFTVIEKIGDRIEVLENRVLAEPGPGTINDVHRLKRELLVMRKAVWPVRDVLNSMIRDQTPLISADTKLFIRDAYDHIVQVIDNVETMRDLVSGMLELYLTSVSQRLNEVIKVLTIISTIFIPLTFVAGVYGMNFDYMPELRWRWGYPAVLVVMAGIVVVMLKYFRRHKWI
jgi:magnesium transporter